MFSYMVGKAPPTPLPTLTRAPPAHPTVCTYVDDVEYDVTQKSYKLERVFLVVIQKTHGAIVSRVTVLVVVSVSLPVPDNR